MAYCLARAVEDLETRFGKAKDESGSNWKYGNVFKLKFGHNPFGETPLRSFYELYKDGEGNHRTINQAWAKKYGKDGPFVGIASSVYR